MIVGFVGAKTVGKDTAADYVCRSYGGVRTAFAEPLKDAVSALFSLTDDQMNTSLKDQTDDFWGVSPRQLLQFIGTDLLRSQLGAILPGVGEDIFVKCLERKLRRITEKESPRIICISDVRFNNEADFIKRNGGILIRITRNVQRDDRSIHASELAQENIETDFTVDNNGTIYELFRNLDLIFSE